MESLAKLETLLQQPSPDVEQVRALLSSSSRVEDQVLLRESLWRLMRQTLERQICDRDPRVRVSCVKWLQLLEPRHTLQLLPKLIRDGNMSVRRVARRCLRRLKPSDVALPDARFRPAEDESSSIGGWNVTGWSAGLFKNARMSGRYALSRRLVKKPKRARKRAPREVSWKTHESFLEFLNLSHDEMRELQRPGHTHSSSYVEYTVAKANGATRNIAAPRPRLKRVQRLLLDKVLAKLPTHPSCHGYVPAHSVLTNAQPHVGSVLVLKTDLRDFFPSVHFQRVRGLFLSYGYAGAIASNLARLCCYLPRLPDGELAVPGVLPQGAPTSPAIANLVCRALDARLSGLAKKVGATYTRYADDLTFSFATAPPEKGIGRFFWWVNQICLQEGFVEHTGKRKVLHRSQQQRVTGLVVNEKLSVPRADIRRFRAMLHCAETKGLAAVTHPGVNVRSYLFGYAAFVQMVHPDKGNDFMKRVTKLFEKSPSGDA